MPDLHVVDVYNTVLTVCTYGLARATIEDVKRALSQVFCEKEVTEAKEVMYDCDVDIGTKQTRKSTINRTAKDANIQDIIDGLQKIDKIGEQSYRFVTSASGLARLPEFLSVIDGMSRLDAFERVLNDVLVSVQTNSSDIKEMKTGILPVEASGTPRRKSKRVEKIGPEPDRVVCYKEQPRQHTPHGCHTPVSSGAPSPVTSGTGTTGNSSEEPLVPVYNGASSISDIMSMIRSNKGVCVPPMSSDKYTYSAMLNSGLTTLTMDIPDVSIDSEGAWHSVGGSSRGPNGSSGRGSNGASGRPNPDGDGRRRDVSRSRGRYGQRDIVKGTGKGGVISGPSKLQTRSVFIYAVAGNPTESALMDYLAGCDISGAKVEKKSHTAAKYSSFKVTVSLDMYRKIRNPEIWDEGILIRDYKEPRRPYF